MQKKMLIRRAAALLLALLLLAVTVSADVIYEPNDDFYTSHAGECTYEERTYTLNGASGNVTVYDNPKSQRVQDAFENGAQLTVSARWSGGGTEWGCVEYAVNESGQPETAWGEKSGWVKMSEMTIVYDNESFLQEHADELISWDGGADELAGAGSVIFWTYPGSGTEVTRMDSADLDDGFAFSDKYTDVDGNVWGYVAYYRGMNGWICLSAPTEENLPLHVGEGPDIIAPVTPKPVSRINVQLIIVIALVALAAIGTLALVLVLCRRNKGKA